MNVKQDILDVLKPTSFGETEKELIACIAETYFNKGIRIGRIMSREEMKELLNSTPLKRKKTKN
ncbi:MAG: hypothetical protein AAFZ15_17370 [Bacteroidota bacterium]